MARRIGVTLIELLVVSCIIAILLAILIPAIGSVRAVATANSMMRNDTPPSEALRVVDELAMEVKVDERSHGGHYHASLRIPIERSKEVTGGMLIAALEKGVQGWASSHDMVVTSFSWSQGGVWLFGEFNVKNK